MASRTAYSTWTPQKPTLFDGHYLRNRSTLDIGVLGYIGIVKHKEHSHEVLSIPPGTPCIILCSVHMSEQTAFILYFVDGASRYNSLLMDNSKHLFVSLFITPLYMFRLSLCSSSGE